MKKRRPSGNDETIFQIDADNRGRFDASRFPDRSASESPPKPRSKPKTAKGKGRDVGSEPGAKDAVGLRIIGGRLRGGKLAYVGDNRVRPMKDRVREAVFNLIGPAVKGMHVVDLFGGTGALAIEAISRGAVSGTVVELHLPTAAMLRRNLEAFGLTGICELRKTDAFFWAKNREEHPRGPAPWLVFCSPPYDFYVNRLDGMLEMLDRLLESAPEYSLFVVESDARFDFGRLPVEPSPKKVRSYPPAEIAIYPKESDVS